MICNCRTTYLIQFRLSTHNFRAFYLLRDLLFQWRWWHDAWPWYGASLRPHEGRAGWPTWGPERLPRRAHAWWRGQGRRQRIPLWPTRSGSSSGAYNRESGSTTTARLWYVPLPVYLNKPDKLLIYSIQLMDALDTHASVSQNHQ